jgi:hypothetical protein
MTSKAADILANALEVDAIAHESGQQHKIGEKFDDVMSEISSLNDIPPRLSYLAINFWDSWQDSRNHEWLYYEPITESDWPRLAREISHSLRSGSLPNNQDLIDRFSPEPGLPFLQRFKNWVFKSA